MISGELFLIVMFLLLPVIGALIVCKKSIYYGWIDRSQKLTAFDYFNRFDGNWIFKTIDYASLLTGNPEDELLKRKIKQVRKLGLTTKVLAGIILVLFFVELICKIIAESSS
jgi:hypothetical protein